MNLFGHDLLVPALIGLGLFAQNGEINLANNTTMLLLLFLLLKKDWNGNGHHNGYINGLAGQCCNRAPRPYNECFC